MRYQAMTGLTDGQLAELVTRLHARIGELRSAGRPYVLPLYASTVMVVALMRKNITQEFAGAVFGVSQPTVSRRWDLLRPLIGAALAEFVPDPRDVVGGGGTVLVDGTICPTWDWKAIPDLYSGKVGFPGINVQVGATLDGTLAAIGEFPVHGARHDAHAYAASGLAETLREIDSLADLGYVGVDGIDIVPVKRLAGAKLHPDDAQFNTELSGIRAAVERAVAHLKTWRMLSEEGGRYRPPISKYASMLKAVIGLIFFSTFTDL